MIGSTDNWKAKKAKTRMCKWIEDRQVKYHKISDALWSYAELSMQEFQSSALLTSTLEAEGFSVDRGLAGMPTCFVASYSQGTGHPVIGILAEFDALPSLSQVAGSPVQHPVVEGAPGHGCSHNNMGATSLFAAVALKHIMAREDIDGTVKVFGCPAEENLISRPFMVRAGLFEGLDAVLDNHGGDVLRAQAGIARGSALYSFEVTFQGRSAHAASRPWDGASALDAVEMMNYGVNMLREHLCYTARIHYVITNGGESPNVVPDKASVWYMVRDSDERLNENYEKVLNCARGAAVATGCTHEVRLFTGIHQNYRNRELARLMQENIAAVGMPDWTEADVRFAKLLQKNNGYRIRGLSVKPGTLEGGTLKNFIGGGSSDVGDITLVVPTATLKFPTSGIGWHSHHWTTVSYSATPIAHKGITAATKILGATGVDLMLNQERLANIQAEFRKLQRKIPYQSYLPDDVVPPVDLNRELMDRFRPLMKPHYFDPESAGYLMDRYRT